MSQLVKLKRSAIEGKIPFVGDIELGEVAINTFDGRMFIKKDDGNQEVIEIGKEQTANEMSFDPSTNDLNSTDVQAAIEEVNGDLVSHSHAAIDGGLY